MDCQITPMTPAHLDQVAALEEICFPEDPWSRRLLAEALENENTTSLLALSEDERVLGYLFFTTVLDEGGVDNIAVHPEARRQGIASALLDPSTATDGNTGWSASFWRCGPPTRTPSPSTRSWATGRLAAGKITIWPPKKMLSL